MSTIKYHSKSEQKRMEALADVGDKSVTKIERKPKYRYYHDACSGNAFLLYEMPKTGDRVVAGNCVHCDGRPIDPGEIAMCDNCGGEIHSFQSLNVLPIL